MDHLSAAGHGETFARLKQDQRYHVLITHYGLRGLGARVHQRGLEAAITQTKKLAKAVPEAVAWLSMETPQGQAYWEALQYLSRWTYANHRLIHECLLARLEVDTLANFGNEDNFVWPRGKLFLHGKGATPAWCDDQNRPLLGLIPLNMASPVLLVLGGNQSDYLSFAPHGAGRNLSRRRVLKQFRQKDGSFDEDAMARSMSKAIGDVDVRWFLGKPDLSESPFGYKPAETVRAQIKQFQLADLVAEIHPLGSIMAGRGKGRDEELTPKQRRQIGHRADRRKERQRLREDWDG